jgi:hypothetical protein
VLLILVVHLVMDVVAHNFGDNRHILWFLIAHKLVLLAEAVDGINSLLSLRHLMIKGVHNQVLLGINLGGRLFKGTV